jgi:hypothetical protein
LTWATRLTVLGAPVVPPAGVLGAVVHRVRERDVTFWRYTPQHDVVSPSSDAIAVALLELHRALRQCEAPEREVSAADNCHTPRRATSGRSSLGSSFIRSPSGRQLDEAPVGRASSTAANWPVTSAKTR